eukprot:15386490-Alexandrium_andersonii.AAC.1
MCIRDRRCCVSPPWHVIACWLHWHGRLVCTAEVHQSVPDDSSPTCRHACPAFRQCRPQVCMPRRPQRLQ